MRFTTTSALLLGAASSAVAFEDQKVLGPGGSVPKPVVGGDLNIDVPSWMKPLENAFGELSSEAKAIWDEVTMLAPEAMENFKKQVVGAKPKPSTRRPDSHWEHVVKGADVQALWTEDENGESHREIGGNLENFNLRVKSVDPSKLGVDKVKQYAGYLDNEANDKHLFYCKHMAYDCPKPTI